MEMITTVPPTGKIFTQVPRKIMSLQDIEAVSRVNVKCLNRMHMVMSYILGIRNRILSEYRAWFHRNTSQHLVTSNKPSPILTQNDKKAKKHTSMMIQACHHPIPNCHWLRPRKSCLYKLSSICNHAAKYEVAPMVTFDQPQSWEGFIIMYNEQQGRKLHSIILRLGGFPIWMTFVVSVDHGILWYRVLLVKDICRRHSQSHGLWWGICERH